MKHLRQTTALLLAAILLVSLLPLQLFSFASDSAIKDEVLFASSFETGDAAIQTSKDDNGYYQGLQSLKLSAVIDGEFTSDVVLSSIQGSDDFNAAESKRMLFDTSSATKFLTGKTPSAQSPVWVSFRLSEAMTLGVYAITSANDESGRDPKNWTLYGSNDGNEYTALDSRTNQSFSGRQQTKTYTVTNTVPYQYYKLEITANAGNAAMTQLADLRLGTGEASGSTSAPETPLTTEISRGPASSYTSIGAFDGARALAAYAEQTVKTESYARNVVYSGLNIKVTSNTKLSYVHFASIEYGYDYDYTSMYLVIDLKFTDGTYLSSLGAVDQNGFGMTPQAKGASESLYSGQWNYIETNVGDVAKGKTIDSVLVYYHKDSTNKLNKFIAYFDDLVIENKADIVHEHLSDYISTLRGTNNTTSFSRGLTTPFITMPNGFNFYTPVTNSGSNTHYSYFANEITHFSVSHVPSTWTGDYGTWQFMANTSLSSGNVASMTYNTFKTANIAASFSHENEIAKAHYYSVIFDEGSKASGVQVEMTPTTHGVFVRFTFPEDAENVNIVFDCVRSSGSISFKADGSFSATSNHTDRGSGVMRIAGAFNIAPSAYKSNGSGGIATFPTGTTEVTMKFATSFISSAQAEHSLELEIPDGETFDSTFAKAQKAWDDICGMVEVEGASYAQLVTLYSCLYRMYAYPNLYSENEGTNEEPTWVYASPYRANRKTSGKLYVNNGFWDTYRTAWAAYALLTPEKDGELLDGIVQHYNDNGWIPRWVAPGGTNSMLGTSSDIIFADAYIKGIEFDYETAYESMIKNAATVSNSVTNGGRAENDTAVFVGYVSNATNNGLSWTLEDYISDYCIGVMSQALGYEDEATYYYNRALSYVNMYNRGLGFFIGKNAQGAWTNTSYDGYGWWGDYSETNGWTMVFAPVYDGNGLANMFGNKAMLLRKLNTYFADTYSASVKVEGGTIHEMVEAREVRMGLYSHSNQPAHAIPYLFVYAGAPYRTQEIVREVLAKCYVGSEIGQGYIGDEDNGEMSAWYVLSAMGLYPQNMGSGQYVIGSPLFDKMTVHMDNGNDLVIIANNNSTENVYVQSLTVNGKAYNNAFIDHSVIAQGATLVFEMGNEPSDWGEASAPTSLTVGDDKPTPATDLTSTSTKTNAGAFSADATVNTLFTGSINNPEKLVDNDSDTAVVLTNGDSITLCAKNSRLLLYTVTSGTNKGQAPDGLRLEASADGATWVTVDERQDLTYEWAKYTRAYEIADEHFANYKFYRLTFLGGSTIQVAEVEFLAFSSDGDAGEASTKPVYGTELASEGIPEDGDNGNDSEDTTAAPDTTDTPVTGDTPNTGDPNTGDDPGGQNGSKTGLIIGIVAAVVVCLGGALVFFFVSKKKVH